MQAPEQPPPKATVKLWNAVARSIVQEAGVSGLEETVASVLHARAFRHFAEGLRQYLAIRVGSADAADVVLRRLRLVAGTWPAAELVAPPGPRARLYRQARELATAQRGMGGDVGASTRAALPWKKQARGVPLIYGRALGEVRSLPAEQAELLELRYARELTEEEIAHVTGLDPALLSTQLAEAEASAEALLGSNPPSAIPGLAGALIEAFSIEPPAATSTIVKVADEPGGLDQGTVLGGRYKLEKRVGAGAFGEVYKASDTEVPGHVIALKLLHQPALSENAKSNALRELNLIASVFHPSIVQFKDHGWFAGRLWFVMPWYDGEPLEKRIAREPLTRAEARTIFEPVARALATMHASGIRHQDIKPDNIFLARLKTSASSTSDDVLPVLLDLGVAAKDTEMMLAGTPLYFPPEVAAQFSDVGKRFPVTLAADVFSLALTIRNSLEPETQEEVPGSAIEAFIAYRAENVPSPPSGKALRYLRPTFERWLHPDPEKRPTADELVLELAQLTAPEERRARRAKTLRWLAPLLVALAVVGGAAFYALRKDAQLSALLAAQARAEASTARAETSVVRTDLAITQARQQALQDDNGSLQAQIRRNNFTHEQLVTELATTQAQVQRLGEAVERGGEREHALRESLTAAELRGTQLTTELGQMRAAREATEARLTQLGGELTRLRQELDARVGELAQSRADATRLTQELADARSQASALSAQLEPLRSLIAAAEQRTRDVEAIAADLRRENERLRAQLAARPAPATPAPADDPTAATTTTDPVDVIEVQPAPGVTPVAQPGTVPGTEIYRARRRRVVP
jgi:hypothetical protein